MTTIIDSPPGLNAYFDRPNSQNFVWAIWQGEQILDWYTTREYAAYKSMGVSGSRTEKLYKELSDDPIVQAELAEYRLRRQD